MPTVKEILTANGCDWRIYDSPLPQVTIQAACGIIELPLPSKLVELYSLCNGGEGSLPFQPWTFVLWGIDEVATLRVHEHYKEFYPTLVFFGGNGAGEFFGFGPDGRIFFMDPIAGESSIEIIAQNFDEFLLKIGYAEPEGVP